MLSRRLLSGAALMLAVSTVAFVMMQTSSDAVARNILGESATSAQVAQKAVQLGLDRPLTAQYVEWLGNTLMGDFGTSWFTSEPASALVGARLPVTLSMVIAATAMTAVLSVVLGTMAAVRGGALDRIIQIVSVLGFALPSFWIALLLVLGFAIWLQLLPATGYIPLTENPIGWAATLVLPVTALVIGGVAATAQQVRGAMIGALGDDYIRTLRARGVTEASVVWRHGLRNAMPPALSVLSVQFISLLGGAVVIEKVFAIPGMGALTVEAAIRGDAPVLMAVVVVMVAVVVIVNLVTDVAASLIDPRVRVR